MSSAVTAMRLRPVDALREMLALLPKHKGTEKLQADLKHRLAKLEEEGERTRKGGARRFDPGHVRREGAGQWVLLGPPNAGKSALLRALTRAHPEVAPYPFTTRAPMPGMMPFEDVQVQVVDTPAVTPEHVEPYLPNLVHGADGVVLVLDVTADDVEQSAAALAGLLERARVWPAARPLPPDASPRALTAHSGGTSLGLVFRDASRSEVLCARPLQSTQIVVLTAALDEIAESPLAPLSHPRRHLVPL